MRLVKLTVDTGEQVYINLDLAVRIDQAGAEGGSSIHFLSSGLQTNDIVMQVKETPEEIIQTLINTRSSVLHS